MIKSVIVQKLNALDIPDDSNYLELELTGPEKSGLLITNITGIGAPKGDINMSEAPFVPGGIYNSSTTNSREIGITLKYIISTMAQLASIEQVRHRTYRHFRITSKIRLTFVTDEHTVYIDGYVEANEGDIFTDDEGSTITVKCPQPYFKRAMDQAVSFDDEVALFEFPLEPNEWNNLTEIELGESYGTIESDKRTIIYDGDIEIGMKLTIHFKSSTDNMSLIRIINDKSREEFDINITKVNTILSTKFGIQLTQNDMIHISSVVGNKYMKAMVPTSEGVKTISIMNALPINTNWLEIVGGENKFSYEIYDHNNNELPHNTVTIDMSAVAMYEGV